MVTQETQGFLDRFSPPSEGNSPTSRVPILLMAIGIVVVVVPLGCL
jgi:hypothetical protein